MNTALVLHKHDCDQHEHHDEDDALLIPRKFENPKQALHLLA
jgi:hypothetical protein